MLKSKRHITIIILTVFLFGQTFAQNITTIDFYTRIKNFDLSTILIADSILIEDMEDKDKIQRAEILGFIGDNYQRFQIHFVSIIQNPTNHYEYFAYGKTKVKETVCSFQGTIKITKSELYKESDIPTYKQGYVVCDVVLYEDNKQNSTGFFFGKLTSNFIIDNKGVFRYDALMFVGDGFCNNQFVGTWTSYKTNSTKKCNWGDYRIPESGDFDIGAGEFSVDDKYVKNGWENYKLAWGTYPETLEVKKARQKENEQWWK
jgi:hypothetical protein